MRRALGYLVGLGLLVLAFAVGSTAPGEPQTQRPFPVTGDVGEQIVSDHVIVTLHEASLAREVELSGWRGTTSGIWLALDVTAEARARGITLNAEARLGETEFAASKRTTTLSLSAIDAGFPETGPLLFELPADVLDGGGAKIVVVQIGSGLDMRLDSVVELRIDLRDLEVQDALELDGVRAGER